jgi:histone deacetylase 1/2
VVYVDDIIVISSSDVASNCLIASLGSDFFVRDLGKLHYFLGLEVTHSDHGLVLTQKKYTHHLLHRAGMLDCRTATTPMSSTDYWSVFEGVVLSFDDATVYRSIFGGL